MQNSLKKVRIRDLARWKRQGRKITMLTAYDATMARLLDCAGVDAILVGEVLMRAKDPAEQIRELTEWSA